jgi:hypothetical protein
MNFTIKELIAKASWEKPAENHVYYGYLNRFTISYDRVSIQGVFSQLLHEEIHSTHNMEKHFADDLLNVLGPHLSVAMIKALQQRLEQELHEHEKIINTTLAKS